MCCLTYENNTYKNLRKKFPKIGKTIRANEKSGKVIRHNVIGKRVAIRLDNGTEVEISLEDIAKNSM